MLRIPRVIFQAFRLPLPSTSFDWFSNEQGNELEMGGLPQPRTAGKAAISDIQRILPEISIALQ